MIRPLTYKYKYLVVTGHSLGAGTAVILGFILRQKYKDKHVKCYAFSPPGEDPYVFLDKKKGGVKG